MGSQFRALLWVPGYSEPEILGILEDVLTSNNQELFVHTLLVRWLLPRVLEDVLLLVTFS